MKKLSPITFILLLFITEIIYPQQENLQLPDTLFNQDFLSRTIISCSAFDLTAEAQIINKNEKLLLRPASNQKILTSAAALLFLGEDYNFETSVYYTGNVDDSVCHGDIFIKGGCDPDFTSADLDSLVREIKSYGINKITGNLYADVSMADSLFWGKGWMWDDDPAIYSPYLSPLSINKNGIKIIAAPTESGKPVNFEIFPKSEYYSVVNKAVTVDSTSSKFRASRDWLNRKNLITLSGEISSDAENDTLELNLFDPVKYFLTLMQESFSANGIEFSGITDTTRLPEEAEKIFSYERNLEQILPGMNKESDNLSAELILRALAYFNSGNSVRTQNGIQLLDSLITLAGHNPGDYRNVDGSGLSFYNLSSAGLITDILKYLYNEHEDLFVILYNSFPVAGLDGTLKDRMESEETERRIHAKTGSLSGVSNLSGYLTTFRNHLIAFSILVQNYTGSLSQAKSIQEKICTYIIKNY